MREKNRKIFLHYRKQYSINFLIFTRRKWNVLRLSTKIVRCKKIRRHWLKCIVLVLAYSIRYLDRKRSQRDRSDCLSILNWKNVFKVYNVSHTLLQAQWRSYVIHWTVVMKMSSSLITTIFTSAFYVDRILHSYLKFSAQNYCSSVTHCILTYEST